MTPKTPLGGVPIAFEPAGILDLRDVPMDFWGKVSAVCRSHMDCLDLSHWFGDEAFCPYYPVLLMVPDGKNSVVYEQIAGLGLCEVWELRDTAVAVWEMTEERLAKYHGKVVDFDAMRERRGLMRREKVDEAIREGFWEMAKKHKASVVTDPGRQPRYPNPLHKMKFPEMPAQAWKGEA